MASPRSACLLFLTLCVAFLSVTPGCKKKGPCEHGPQITEPRAGFDVLGGYPPGVYACGKTEADPYPLVALKTTQMDDAERTLDDFAKSKGWTKLQLAAADRAAFEAALAGNAKSFVLYKKGTSLLSGGLELEQWGAVVFQLHSIDCTKATSLDDRNACEKYGK